MDTNWRNFGDTTRARWDESLRKVNSPILDEGGDAYAAASPHSRLCLAMMWAESQHATDFNQNTKTNRNALNLRPPTGGGYMAYGSWTEGIKAWRTRITSTEYKNGIYKDTTTIRDLIEIYAPSFENDVNQYVATVEAVINRLPVVKEEVSPMSIPVSAPPLEIAITPPGANRPALEMPSPSWITVHEVGNQSPGADENMHRNFVHNGGGAGEVSFHFVVGPTKAIQLIPLDEAAWHASDGYTGTGNRDSVAIETIQIGDFDKTLWHLAWLINEIATNPDRFFHNKPRSWDMSIQQIAQHNHWAPDGKNCPEFIRNRGLWPTLMERVDLWHTNSVPGDTTTPPPPKYAKPNVPDWLIDDTLLKVEMIDKTPTYPVSMVFTATKDTPRRQGGDPNLAEVGPVLKKGQRFRSTRVFRSRNKTWVLTKNGSRIAGDDLSPRVIVSVDGHVSVQF